MPLKIPTVQTGLEKSIRNAVKNVSARGGLNLSINDRNFSRPLGKITGSVSEFNKSLEASNARVLAFGASVGMIQGVQKAFASLVTTTIEVERKLTEINVVMGLTNSQLEDFGKSLFKVAKNTAQSFDTVANAATELARQGLGVEETLRRANDALILTRLTGLDAAAAVSGLTAALNTFNKAGLDSTQILSKMAAVDVQFAVSTEDLIDAVSRAGAVANDAGVSFDELLGAVTAAQQMTARGGKVIGNSFKTIFTRVQRSSTIKRLEELGIAVRDIQGNTLPAINVLQNLAKTYDTLADTTKAAVAEQVGGVFQINILKAAIKDLSAENSILARATQISAQATDEAYKKNEILNRSLSALTSQAATSIKELSGVLGEIAFADQIRDYLTFIKDQVSSISGFISQKEGESAGSDFLKGVIRGIGNVLSGPGLFLTLSILGKLFVKTFSFLAGSGKELLGVVSAAEKQKQIQTAIVTVLNENSALQKRILSQEGNRAAQEKTILTILQQQAREQAKIAAAARAVAPGISRAGFGGDLRKTRSEGHIPNYVSPSERASEKKGARKAGYTPGAVKSMNLKGEGRIIYNTAETVKRFSGLSQPAIMPPQSSRAGRKYKKAFTDVHGVDPYANRGYIPNYARGGRTPMVYKPTPYNLAHGLIYGKRRALNLDTGGGRLLKDAWHSSKPALSTSTELDSIRTIIYKKFLSKKDPTFIKQVEDAMAAFGNTVPSAWSRGNGYIDGMLLDLNMKRAQARGLSSYQKLPPGRMLGPQDPLMGGAMSQGMIPNYMKMLGLKELMSKAGGAAKSLITTPFKDAGTLIKGGYKGIMGVEHMLRSGIKGTYKGLQFGEKMIRAGLGKGFDFMKNFPRTTLYGGGGGAGFAFQDQIMAAIQKYGPKALEMGSKIGKGALDIFQNPTAHVDLISAVLGGVIPAGVLGFTLLDDVLRVRKDEKARRLKAEKKAAAEKLGKELKEGGKHRGNLMVRDLPPELQKIAMGRMKIMNPQVGPGGPRSTSFVPKSILDELGLASGFVPNYALNIARLQESATYVRGKLNPKQARSQGRLKDFILRRAKLNPEAREFEPPKFDLTMARDGKPVGSLDNPTASRARAAVITSDGKTHLGFWHDDIRDDLARRKIDLKGAKDLELLWANKGFIPNYSAFHFDKNLPMSMPKAGDRITFLKALEFMPEHKLAQAMDLFLKETQMGLDMKASYPGMPIKDFKKHFGGSLSLDMGLNYLSDKRQKEILRNPDVMKSFYRYLTGKSSSIGIESALTADERKYFLDKYGMIPRMKSVEDGFGQTKKDRLSLLREDFLRAGEGPGGGKKGSVRGYIQEAFKQSRGKQNIEKLLAQNQALAPPPVLGLPYDPERSLTFEERRRRLYYKLARSNPDVLNTLHKVYGSGMSRTPKSGSLEGIDMIIDKEGNAKKIRNRFGDISGRFRGVDADIALQRKIEAQHLESQSRENKRAAVPVANQVALRQMLKENATGSSMINQRAFDDFEDILKDDRTTTREAEKMMSGRFQKSDVIDEIMRERGVRRKNLYGENFSKLGRRPLIRDKKNINLNALPTLDDLLALGKEGGLPKNIPGLPSMRELLNMKRFGHSPKNLSNLPTLKELLKLRKFRSFGNIPNFALRINTSKIKPISKPQGRIHGSKYDETIGLSQLDEILRARTFSSIKYRPKGQDIEELVLSKARSGVHQYKKGKPPPKGYESWNEFDLATGTRVIHASSAGKGSGAYRRLALNRVHSVVSGGKHYRVDPLMASHGLIPNFININPAFSKFRKMGSQSMPSSGGGPRLGAFSDSVKYSSNNLVDTFAKGILNGKLKLSQASKEIKETASFVGGKSGFELLQSWSKLLGNKTFKSKINKGMMSSGLIPNFANLGKLIAAHNAKKRANLAIREPAVQLGVVGIHPGKNPLTDSYIKAYKQGKITEKELYEMMRGQAAMLRGQPGKFEAQMDYVAMNIKNAPGQIRRKNINDMRSGATDAFKGFLPNYASLFSEGASKILSKNPEYGAAVKDAISREASFGLTPKVVQAPSLKSSTNPGLAVVNQEQEGGSLAKARTLHGGLNPKQKSGVPNYASPVRSIGGAEVMSMRAGVRQAISMDGLKAMQDSFYRAASAIDKMTASTQRGRQFLKALSKEYGNNANLIKEANIREKAKSRGLTSKDGIERNQFARQMFRKDALKEIAGTKGPLGTLASNLLQTRGGKFEEALLFQQGVAKKSGDKETLNALRKLDSAMEKSARNAMDGPKNSARMIERALKQNQGELKALEKFQGTGGFNKGTASKFFAQEFIRARDPNFTGGQREANSIMAMMGKAGQKEFRNFLQEKGVMSSNKALASAGLQSGQFRQLVGGPAGTSSIAANQFIRQLGDFQKALEKGDKRTARALERSLLSGAVGIGRDSQSAKQLQQLVQASKDNAKENAKKVNNTAAQTAARDRLRGQAGGGMAAKFFSSILGNQITGSFMSGASGAGLRGSGFGTGIANRAGRVSGSLMGAARNFGTSGALGKFGGQMGLGMSFIAPMVAGMVSNKQDRAERAVFNKQTGSFEVQDRGGDVASSVLMGAGLGALFGPAGMIVGAMGGFFASMKKATLTIDEQIRMREKEIAVIGQNVQATQNIQNLQNARRAAFEKGNKGETAKLDAMINRTLAGITDKEVLNKVAIAAGNEDSMAVLQKELQDQMTIATSTQNFGMAIKNKNSRNAGVAIGSIIAQGIRDGDTDESEALALLSNIRKNVESRKRTGAMLSTEQMNEIRTKAEGRQGMTSMGTVGGGLAAGLVTAGVATSMSGVGLPLGLVMTAIGAALGAGAGRYFESENAQNTLREAQAMGVDEIMQFDKLVQAGVITESAMNSMVAAFKEGEVGIEDIAREAESAVRDFNNVRKASESASKALFNLDKKLKLALSRMTLKLEVEKIQNSAAIQAESSNTQFLSQFMSPTRASEFMANQQSGILSREVGFKMDEFAGQADIDFLRKFNSSSMNLTSVTPRQKQDLVDAVERRGIGIAEDSIASRAFRGTIKDQTLTRDQVNQLASIVGIKDSPYGDQVDVMRTMPFNTQNGVRTSPLFTTFNQLDAGKKDEARGKIANILGVSSDQDISAALKQVDLFSSVNTRNLDPKTTRRVDFEDSIIGRGGAIEYDYLAQFNKKDAEAADELLEERDRQKKVLEAQITAMRKGASIQIAQNRIQAKIQEDLELMQARVRTRNIDRETSLIREKGDSTGRVSNFKALTSERFRGSRDDASEAARQKELRKKIFQEELKIQKAENLETFKKEAERLMSEKNLIDALNNLRDTISPILDIAASESGGPKTSTAQMVPSSPSGAGAGAGGGSGGRSGGGSSSTVLNANINVSTADKALAAGDKIAKRTASIDELQKQVDAKANEVRTKRAKLDFSKARVKPVEEHLNRLFHLAMQPYDGASGTHAGQGVFKDSEMFNAQEKFIKKYADQIAKDTGRGDILFDEHGHIRPLQSNPVRRSGQVLDPATGAGKGSVQLLEEYKDSLKANLNIKGQTEGLATAEKEQKTLEAQLLALKDEQGRAIAARNAMQSGQARDDIAQKLKGQTVDIQSIDIGMTNLMLSAIDSSGSIESALEEVNKAVTIAGNNDPVGILAEKAQGLKSISEQMNQGIREMERRFNLREAKIAVEDFSKTLKFFDYSRSTFSEINALSNADINAQSASSALRNASGQIQRQKEFETIMGDPTATNLQKAEARIALESQTIGTQSQRDRFVQISQEEADLSAQLTTAQFQKTEAIANKDKAAENKANKTITSLESQLKVLNKNAELLALAMQRTTPRGEGRVVDEIRTNLGNGLQGGFAAVESSAEGIYTRLGQDMPYAMRNGMVDAMQAALSGADDLSGKLSQIGISFLQMIQRAFLESAASRVVGAIGSVTGLGRAEGNSGGIVSGGSGVKDDVPAMLMGGEYVIKKSSVDKYGVNFLEQLNNGTLTGYRNGGGVNLAIGAPRAAEREEYTDENKDGNVTRYRVKKKEVGINRALTGYAISKDRKIQEFFRDQETQFNEDLSTKRQEEMRAENKKRRKKAEKNALLGIIYGIVGGALLSKGIDFAKNKYKQSSFGQRRFDKKTAKDLQTKGTTSIPGGSLTDKFESPSDRARVQQFYQNMLTKPDQNGQVAGPIVTARTMWQNNQGGSLDANKVELRRNKGGGVPARLTGGEYVMSPSAVKTYGASMMKSINNGSYNAPSSSGSSNQPQNTVTHGDVNISINVSDNGSTTTTASNPLNTREFASKVKNAVIEVIGKEKRVGGKLR